MADESIALPLKFVIVKHLVDACYLLYFTSTSEDHQ